MLQKAEEKLKNDDKELVVSPWQTTSIKIKSSESKNNVGTNVETKSTESKNNVGTNVETKSTESKNNVGTNVETKSTESKNNVGTNVETKSTESKNNVGTNVETKSTESKNNVGTNVETKSTESKNNVGTNVETKSTESKNNVGTNVETKSTESKNNVGTNVETKSTESKNNVGTNVETKSTESKNNVGTNVETKSTESKNNIGTNVETKSTESKNNVGTNVETKSTESKNNVGTNVETKSTESKNNVGTNVETKSTESKNNVGTNVGNKLYFKIQHLTGIQLDLMRYIYANKFNENKHFFVHINTKQASSETGISLDIFRVSLRRIENKKIIIRDLGVMGRHGFSIFRIPSETIKFFDKFHIQKTEIGNKNTLIYNSNSITTNINKHKNASDVPQPNDTDKDKIIADLQKQLELQKQQLTNQSYSTTPQSEKDRLTDHINKRLNDIDTQTDTENSADTQDNSEAWAEIDFSSLAGYGFKKSHIKQIINANTSLTPQEVQDSIEHYAWALENRREEMKGYAPVSNPLRGLMGVLKKGNAWVEGSYKSPEELALELQIKNKRMQLERQQAKKDELFNIEFEMWYTELTPKDIAKIEATNGFRSLPIATFNKKMSSSMYRGLMQGYFRDTVLNNKPL